MVPAQWYEILKYKKSLVIVRLVGYNIKHDKQAHIMTLKSQLYQYLKSNIKSLTNQFKQDIGSDWTTTFKQSNKSFKDWKKQLLRKYHPDLNNGSTEATQITQTINNWSEPIQTRNQSLYDMCPELKNMVEEQKRKNWAKFNHLSNLGKSIYEIIQEHYKECQDLYHWLDPNLNYPYEIARKEVMTWAFYGNA